MHADARTEARAHFKKGMEAIGQGRYEEVDRIRAGRGGVNLGWPCREGTSTYDPSRCRSGATYTGPVTQYGRSLGQSVTGGHVYRGRLWRDELGGRYVFADFYSGRVWTTTAAGRRQIVGSLPSISSFGVDDGGEIWAVTYDGGLHRLRATRA